MLDIYSEHFYRVEVHEDEVKYNFYFFFFEEKYNFYCCSNFSLSKCMTMRVNELSYPLLFSTSLTFLCSNIVNMLVYGGRRRKKLVRWQSKKWCLVITYRRKRRCCCLMVVRILLFTTIKMLWFAIKNQLTLELYLFFAIWFQQVMNYVTFSCAVWLCCVRLKYPYGG